MTTTRNQWTAIRHTDFSRFRREADANGYLATMTRDFTRAGTAWNITIWHHQLINLTMTTWGTHTDVQNFINSLIEDQLTRA